LSDLNALRRHFRVAEQRNDRPRARMPPSISHHCALGLDEAETQAKPKGFVSQSEMERFATPS